MVHQRLLHLSFLISGALLIYIAYIYPIYPDEITNIFLTGRNGIDNSLKLWLMPACVSKEIYIPIPLLYVYSSVELLFNQILTHRALRNISLILSLGMIWFWYWLVKKKGSLDNFWIICLIFLLPPIFVNSFIYLRPEKYILLFLIFSIYLNLYKNTSLATISLYSFIFLVAIINHPKSYYFIIIYLFIIVKNFNKVVELGTIYKLGLLLIVFTVIYQNYFLSLDTYSCNQVPFVRDFISNYALNPMLIFKDPAEFLNKIALFNDFSHSLKAVSQFFIKSDYDIGYLPNIINSKPLIYLINLPIVYLVAKIFYNFIFNFVNKRDVFYIIYLLTIMIVYLFSGNKGAYDIAFTITALIAILPFAVHNKISLYKYNYYYLVLIIIYSYIIMLINLTNSWVGPGVQLLERINYEKISLKTVKYIRDFDSVIYDDSTTFIFNSVKEKYPITYINNLASPENNLVKSNLKGKVFLYVGRCVYLESMKALQQDVEISVFEQFTVEGVTNFYQSSGVVDYVCIAKIN